MSDVPIACTLPGVDMKARLAAIAELNRVALKAQRRAGLILELDYDAAVADRVREFVALEQRCCGFLEFAVEEHPGLVRVRITAPAEAALAADALFDQFSAGGTATPCGCAPSQSRSAGASPASR